MIRTTWSKSFMSQMFLKCLRKVPRFHSFRHYQLSSQTNCQKSGKNKDQRGFLLIQILKVYHILMRFIWNRSRELPWTLLCVQTAARPLPFCRTGPWSVHDYLHSVFWAECVARTQAEASNPAYEAPCKSCHSDSPTKVSRWKNIMKWWQCW